jgi:hypothetical protein
LNSSAALKTARSDQARFLYGLRLAYIRRDLPSNSPFASETGGINTAAAAAAKPAGVVRTVALRETELPIVKSTVAFISSGVVPRFRIGSQSREDD